MPPGNSRTGSDRLDRVVAEARRKREQREKTHRDRAPKIHPWVRGRSAREFTHATVRMRAVHHRDHDHENNPSDGSNWEPLCVYCHRNEHARILDSAGRQQAPGKKSESVAVHQPFAEFASVLKGKK